MKIFNHIALASLLILPLNTAFATSTEFAELRTGFTSPFSRAGVDGTGSQNGITVRFNVNQAPTASSQSGVYQWGVKLQIDGSNTKCKSNGVFAGIGIAADQTRQFVIDGLQNFNSCAPAVGFGFNWQEGSTYELNIERDSYVTAADQYWTVTVTDLSTRAVLVDMGVYAGATLQSAAVVTHLQNVTCADPSWQVSWSHPTATADDKRYRVDRLGAYIGESACADSKQNLVHTCDMAWTHQMGISAKRPIGSYPDSETIKAPLDCRNMAEGTGLDVAKAYVQAISDGPGPKAIPETPLDFSAMGCNAQTVWNNSACQAAVLNGHDGKTFLMNGISPVSSAANWRQSNIQDLIPPATMKDIMTNPKLRDAKSVFGYMSNPNNNWYSWLGGDGQAKSVLRQYMDSAK